MNKRCEPCEGSGLVYYGTMDWEDCAACHGFGTLYADPREWLYCANKRYQSAVAAHDAEVRRRWFWQKVPDHITEEVTRSRLALKAALDAVDALKMYSPHACGWCSPESAPKDGTQFLWLQIITVTDVDSSAHYEYRVQLVERKHAVKDSDGFWMGQCSSISDLEFNSGLWQPVNLPMAGTICFVLNAKR